jgi:hypothetical protein
LNAENAYCWQKDALSATRGQWSGYGAILPNAR